MHDFQITYFNKAENQVLGIASAVVHNAAGQTLTMHDGDDLPRIRRERDSIPGAEWIAIWTDSVLGLSIPLPSPGKLQEPQDQAKPEPSFAFGQNILLKIVAASK